MAEPVGDESIYLRLDLLKKGLVQFTDATTAARLVREHGRDIRYNAAWKKWVVWENTHWQMDDGALIHEKGLEMVRNIYNDLLKMVDYRDRMEQRRIDVAEGAGKCGYGEPTASSPPPFFTYIRPSVVYANPLRPANPP
jgi:hypothetical protein